MPKTSEEITRLKQRLRTLRRELTVRTRGTRRRPVERESCPGCNREIAVTVMARHQRRHHPDLFPLDRPVKRFT